MIPCPKCDGGKNPLVCFPAFPTKRMLNLGKEKLMETFACHHCKGTGNVMDEMQQWIHDGEGIKDRRINAKLLLRDAARSVGLLPSTLSDMERGIIKPDLSIRY